MHIEKKTLRNIFIGVSVCIVLYWFLSETERVAEIYDIIKGVLSPFVIGACLAFILNVPMRSFEHLVRGVNNTRLRRTISVLLTLVAVLLVLALVFWLLIPQLISTIQSLIPKLYAFIDEVENAVRTFLEQNPQVMEWVVNNTDFENLDWAGLVEKAISMIGNSVSTILDKAFSAIGSIAGAVFNMFISIVFAVYCLFQKETLARQGRKLLYAFLPEKVADKAVHISQLTNGTFSNFLSGQCIEVCILGGLFAISMAIFNMPYIPLVSVLVAVTAFIPVVGAWVGCILGAFFIFVADPVQAFWFVIMFVVLQQIENNLIYPRVVGTSIGLSGMWVLVAVAVGGELMGVIGMFLMIPFASVIYSLLREFTNRHLQEKEVCPDKLIEQPIERNRRMIMKSKNGKKQQDKQNKEATNE
ncbi:MAG: AI-2E family transporter [Oscillospiraceae bacterium]|nr:AI-2E family transporter [Oscillospiraceae bacterium]